MDAAQDDSKFPFGELLIIRQVLQHLSNDDVKKILTKTKDFKYILITEHIYDGADAIFNIDKPASNTIRLSVAKSGLYLEKPPFNYKNIVHLLKLNQYGGTIRTSLIIN